MALDTREKRMSLVALNHPWQTILPLPDGDIGVGDRAQWIAKFALDLVTIPARDAVLEVLATPRNFEVLATPRDFGGGHRGNP